MTEKNTTAITASPALQNNMKKFDGILICTDLDGTLIKNDHTISKENLEAIEYFKSQGGLFTFVTGRMPYTARGLADTVKPNAPIGCVNGGGIYDYAKEEYVFLKSLPSDVSELIDFIVERVDGISVILHAPDKMYFSISNDASERHRISTGTPFAAADYKDCGFPIAKIIFADSREDVLLRVAELLSNHPRKDEFDFVRSDKALYEILPKGTSKGAVLPRLAEHLGVELKKAVCVGDYYNDVDMLKAAGIGIAVENACPEAKAASDYITVSNEESAIARIISDIESGAISI